MTGGAGFIGGHLVDALLSLGAHVTVIDDLSNSRLDHLADLIELDPERVQFIRGSILEPAALSDAIRPGACEVVFHLAAVGSVPRSIEEPARTWDVNATGTMRVLEAARGAGVRRVVFAASSSAYGDGQRLPMLESAETRPLSPYAVTKVVGEQLCRVWARCYGLSTVSLRYFNVFGPRQAADSQYAAVVAAFATKLLAGEPVVIYGDGSQTRDFTFVTNAVLATLLAGSCPRKLEGEVINVGCGRRTSILELAHMMAEIARSKSPEPEHRPAREGEVPHSLAELSRARELLGYDVICRIEDGLEDTIAWYRSLLKQDSVTG